MVPPNRGRSSLNFRNGHTRRDAIRSIVRPTIRVRPVHELNDISARYSQHIQSPAIIINSDLPLVFPNRPTHRAGSPTQDIIEFPLDFPPRSYESVPQITNDIPPQELIVTTPPILESGSIESTSPNPPDSSIEEIIAPDIDLSAFDEPDELDAIAVADTLPLIDEILSLSQTDLDEILGPCPSPNLDPDLLNFEPISDSLDALISNVLYELSDPNFRGFNSELILPDHSEE